MYTTVPKGLTWQKLHELITNPPCDGRAHFWIGIEEEFNRAVNAAEEKGDVPLGMFWANLPELWQNAIEEALEN